jgi:hypothetical protein
MIAAAISLIVVGGFAAIALFLHLNPRETR